MEMECFIQEVKNCEPKLQKKKLNNIVILNKNGFQSRFLVSFHKAVFFFMFSVEELQKIFSLDLDAGLV